MSPKRFLLLVVLAFVAFAMLPSSAAAGNFDEELMGCPGESPGICPAGTVGQPYSLTIYLMPRDGGRGEDFGCATFKSNGTFPPGLSISDEGYITGTPTQAGNYAFFLEVHYNANPGCNKPHSDDTFVIPINPGIPPKPKLVIGPETTTSGTVGTAYQLQMTANLPDAKTWSVAAGTLPGGLTLDPATGLISGTPLVAGTFSFTVSATIDATTSDTKTLTIVVRNQLLINGNGVFSAQTRVAQTEVGAKFFARLAVTGGLGPYEVEQTGLLPDGIEFDVTDNSLSGQSELPGTYRFAITATDSEGRTATYAGRIVVAQRLAIVTKRLTNGRVGVVYRSKLRSSGGVAPIAWRIKAGPLPRGIRFDRATGTFVGIPAKAGTWVITIEIQDALRVKTTATVVVLVKPALVRPGNR